MNNEEGKSWFGLGIDNTQLQTDANRSMRIFNSIGDKAVAEGARIDNTFNKIAKSAAAIFTIDRMKDFVTQTVKVRGQFQQLEIAFSTMLKSEEKATKLMSELTDFAARTPFGLDSAASGAKQLLAYGSAAETVIEELEMLGDVAAGTGQQIGDLVFLYGTLRTQGRAYAQDIRQFAGRGIPIYDELAKVLDINKDKVNDFVAAGKVGFAEVEQAFKNMTSVSGMFGGLMEAQSKSVTGRLEQLSDAIQVMFNNIGSANEGVIYSAIDSASNLVENYDKVGKMLLELVSIYGAYKAVVIAASAFNKTTNSVKIIEEAKSLERLLSTEQKAVISKQNLTKGTIEYALAVKSAALSNVDAAKKTVSQLGLEASAQKTAMDAAKLRAGEAAKLTAQRKAELATIVGEAEAEKSTSLQKQMAAESERQSRLALRVVRLQEQKDVAIAQAQALKEAGASQEKITTKNREIAAIHNKITAAKAEEIQSARTVSALRAEIKAIQGSAISKKIDSAQKKLDTAITRENTAVLTKNAAMKEFYSQKAKIQAASQNAATLSTKADTAVQSANITVSNLLALAKTKLISVTQKLNTTLKANVFSIVALAAVALAYGIYKLITYQTEADKAQKRLNDTSKEFVKTTASEQAQIDILFGRLKAAKEGTEAYDKAKNDIISKYGQYLNGLNEEIRTLKNVEEAYKAISKAAIQSAKDRAIEKGTKEAADAYAESWEKNTTKIRDAFLKKFGDLEGEKLFQKLRTEIEEGKALQEMSSEVQQALDKWDKYNPGYATQYGAMVGGGGYVSNKMEGYISKIQKSKQVLDNEVEEINSIYGNLFKPAEEGSTSEKVVFSNITEEINVATENIAKFKKELADLRSGTTQSTNYASDIEAKEKELKEAEARLKSFTGIDEGKQKEQAEKFQKQQEKLIELQESYCEEYKRAIVDAENAVEQARINTMEEGTEKILAQMRLDHKRELEELERERADHLQHKIDNAKALFEANPANKGKTFDGSNVQLTEQEDASFSFRKTYAEAKQANEDKKLVEEQRRTMNEYLAEYGQYMEKRQAITDLYTEKMNKALTEGERLTLGEEMKKELSEMGVEANKKTSAISRLFGDMSKKAVKDMRSIAAAGEKALDFIKEGQWDESKGIEFGITKETFEILSKSPEQLESIKNEIANIRNEADKAEPALNKIAKGLEKIFSSSGDKNELKKGLESFESGLNEVMQSVQIFSNSVASIFSSFGNDSVAETINGITQIAGGAAEAATGVAIIASGDIIGGISSLAKGISNVVSGIVGISDATKEKKIQKLQGQIEALEETYARLGSSIEKAYSKDASKLIVENNKLLEQKKFFIQQQINEEKDKKKTDSNRIKEWEQQLKDIDELISENEEKAKDVIFGEDIKAAIENFADAYADAWASGTDRAQSAKDTVKQMMKQMAIEAIKQAVKSSEAMKKIRDKLEEFYADEVLSGWEQDYIYNMAENLQKELDSKFGWADSLLSDGSSASQDSTKRGFGNFSQDSVDEVNGRLTGLQMSAEVRTGYMLNIMDDVKAVRLGISIAHENAEEIKNLSLISVGHLEAISKNTHELYETNNKLEDIRKSLKNL